MLVATDGGKNEVKGYYGWVISAGYSVLWVCGGVLSTHSSQLNLLRPESVSYLSALAFLPGYMTKYKTKVAARVDHVVDNSSLVYRMHDYNRGCGRTPKLVVRSDMDVQLQIEAESEGLYKDHR